MKSLFILLTVVSSLLVNNSFATETKEVAQVALQSFKTTFSEATDVTWSVKGNLFRADFAMSGLYASAYYDTEGVLVATTRNITFTQLPILLQASLKKESKEYWITDLFELTNSEGTHYYITLETADKKLVLKAQPSSTWSVYQKSQKA
jgi:hypothetical protein